MTERWKRALETLDRLDPPSDLFDAAEHGPRRADDVSRSAGSRVFAMAAAVVATVAIAAVLGVLFDLRDEGAPRPRFAAGAALDEVPKIPGEDWAGLYPQLTREAAESTADAPNAGEHWQVRPDDVVMRYAGEVLGWVDREIEEVPSESQARVFRVWRCSGEDVCGRNVGVEVEVQRLLGPESGYWFVTGARFAPAGPGGARLEDRAVESLLRSRAGAVVSLFVVSRLDRSKAMPGGDAAYGTAERYLSDRARKAYENSDGGLYLYGAPDGHPRLRYSGFDIVEPPTVVENGTFRALISVQGDPVDGGGIEVFHERLVLEPVDGKILITHVEPA